MVFRKVPNPSLHSHCMKHLCIVSCMFAAMQSNFPTEAVLAFFPRPQLSEPHLRNDERYELMTLNLITLWPSSWLNVLER